MTISLVHLIKLQRQDYPQLVDGSVSHDKISRFLAERKYTSKDLWKNFPVFLHRQIFTNKDGSTCALQARKILRPEMVATVKLRSAAVYQVLRGVR